MTRRTTARTATTLRRRTPTVRRRSAGLSPTRAAAALALVLAALAIYGVSTAAAFGLDRLDIRGERYVDEASVKALVGVPPGTNLFRLSASAIEARIAGLAPVKEATVIVSLPDTVIVQIEEREPVLAWHVGDRRLLVDAEGVVVAEEAVTEQHEQTLPIVEDRRFLSVVLRPGHRIDAVDLDVATRLGSLDPADLDSVASGLTVAVDEEQGWVVRPVPRGWLAIFGFYGRQVREADLIPGQVRLLRSLLAGREATVGRVILASETDGTFTERSPGPSPAPSPKPSPAPAPTSSPVPSPSPSAVPSAALSASP